MMITLEQIRAARAMLGLRQQELAQKAGISIATLNNIERGVQTDPKISTMHAIQNALESEGIEFSLQDGIMGLRLTKQRTPATAGIRKILIIDDSDSDRALYKAWLSKQPDCKYNISDARNAKEGYDTFICSTPDCIILDFHMYGKDGFQLLVEMKNGHAKIPPIIFITAAHNGAIEKGAMSMGVSTYLNKNELTKEKLYAAINKALER